MRLFPAYYGEVKRAIERIIARKAGQGATKKALGLRYLQNAIDNIAGMERARPVSPCSGHFRVSPALWSLQVLRSGSARERSGGRANVS
jgi:hypothetical protein